MTKRFKDFVTPHCHVQSLDSASTPEDFAKKEVELGSGALTVTDHGYMGACSDVYDLAKKNNLIPILGQEAYLRDDDCEILKAGGIEKQNGGYSHYSKYCHFCMHAMDETAYHAMSRHLSQAFEHSGEKHGSEIKPIWTWKDVEQLGAYNVTATSGCLIGASGRHLMNGRPDLAEAYYQKLRALVKPGNFYVEIFPHDCSTYYEQGVFLTFADGTKKKFNLKKKLRIEQDGSPLELAASDLAKAFKGLANPMLTAYKHYHTWNDLEPKVIVRVDQIEGFIENECGGSLWNQTPDLQLHMNQFMMGLAEKYGDPIQVSDDSHFAAPEQYAVQTMKLTSGGSNWRFSTSYHRQTSEEAFRHLSHTLGINEKTFEKWIDNSYEFRDRFKDFKFNDKIQLPTSRYPADTVAHLKTLIEKHGRMRWDDQRWRNRLKQEVELFKNNGTIDLLPYFFLAEETVDEYNKKRLLTGPGRGSSGGVGIAYLLGITQVDPIETGMSLDRFLTLDRIQSGKMPDIDMDFGDVNVLKDPETGWLEREFGDKHAAIATKTTLRLKSSIKDAMRSKYGTVPAWVEKMVANFPVPPQGVDDEKFLWGYKSDDEKEVPGFWSKSEELRAFAQQEPEVWDTVTKALKIARGWSRHASAILISDTPIQNTMPTFRVGGYRTTQYTMGGVEARGGLKMDFLGLSTLNDIQDCIELVQVRNGGTIVTPQTIDGVQVKPHHCLPFQGNLVSIWNLPDRVEIYEDICAGRTETVFQLSTESAIKWLKEFRQPTQEGLPAINSKAGGSAFIALDRPGPLDAYVTDGDTKYNFLQEYARRARGLPATGENKALSEMLKETYGILVYQEGLQAVYQKLTQCDLKEATEFRTNIAKKNMAKIEAVYPKFMAQASLVIGEKDAQEVWDQIVGFGNYCFNFSHSQNYFYVSYACSFLKRIYNTEWWTAVLRNAKKDKIVEKHWKYVSHIVLPPDVQMSGDNFQIEQTPQGERIRSPLSMLHGVGEKAHQEIVAGAPYKDYKDFADRVLATKIKGAKPKLTEEGKPQVDKKTGMQAMTMGRSALGNAMVYKLIYAGAMKSLFPAGTSLAQAVELYAQYVAELTAPKTRKKAVTAKVPPEWRNLGPIEAFQVSKQVFPVHIDSLVDIMMLYPDSGIHAKESYGKKMYVQNPPKAIADEISAEKHSAEPYRLIEGNQISYFNSDKFPLQDGQLYQFGTYAYVLAERRFKFPKNAPPEEQKEALSLTMESCGQVFDAVKWPDWDTGKLRAPPAGLEGGVIFCLLSRYKAGKDAKIDVLHVVAPSIKAKKEEETE